MKITLHTPNVYKSEGVRLLPGENQVDDKKAAKFLANKIVQLDIKAGKLSVDGVVAAEEPTVTVEEIAVSEDIDMLQELAEGDKRASVTKAAIARLAEIEGE